MKKNSKYVYIRESVWGGYRVYNNGEMVACDLNIEEAKALARKICNGKSIRIVFDN